MRRLARRRRNRARDCHRIGQRLPLPKVQSDGYPARLHVSTIPRTGARLRMSTATDARFALLRNADFKRYIGARFLGSTGAMKLAAPVVGGMLSSLVHILIVTPVIFAWLHERKLVR